MAPTLILFLIIFLEGYVVLSAELLAIRLLIPFTGSGPDTISVIIAAVLMPLAFGYYAGGRFKVRHKNRYRATVRKKLLRNLLISALILTPGLSYDVINLGFDALYLHTGLRDRVIITTLYAALFIVYPVFLLGQTVPLISNYFPRGRLPALAGRILFFSTLGSFMGAVFCTLVLMTYIGVHYTVCVTIGCLAVLIMILSKSPASRESLAGVACFLAALALNNGYSMAYHDVVANNAYHMIQIEDHANTRSMRINHNMSAMIDRETGDPAFSYIRHMERTFIDPLIWEHGPPRDILVLGAGGFTLGMTDKKNNYVLVDIDPAMKDIAETEFLEQSLPGNKRFVALPARAFLYQTEDKFDLILIDLFKGPSKTPEHLVTKEFYEKIKATLKDGGIMAANYIISPAFSDPFTTRLDNTVRSVFANINRHVVEPYDPWRMDGKLGNVIYSYRHDPGRATGLYTDNLNSAVFDKPGGL